MPAVPHVLTVPHRCQPNKITRRCISFFDVCVCVCGGGGNWLVCGARCEWCGVHLQGSCGDSGDGPPLTLPSKCSALLRQRCPTNLTNHGSRTSAGISTAPLSNRNSSTCTHCVESLYSTDPSAFEVCIKATPTESWTVANVSHVWCVCGGTCSPSHHQWHLPVWAQPSSVLSPCFFPNGTFNPACSVLPLAGQMWALRFRQYLLANGVAVVQPNPQSMDMWEWYGQRTWDNGWDKAFFHDMFASMRNGSFGSLGPAVFDLDRLMVSGFSTGAEMVSWFFQLQATQQLPLVKVQSGVFFAGGSYGCYNVPPTATGKQNVCPSCCAFVFARPICHPLFLCTHTRAHTCHSRALTSDMYLARRLPMFLCLFLCGRMEQASVQIVTLRPTACVSGAPATGWHSEKSPAASTAAL